jgi:hypothetical protein
MCCFAKPVDSGSDTQIFARLTGDSQQAIVYQMQFKTAHDNAMILPLPVKPNSGEAAVSFVSLKKYGNFFKDLDAAFPQPRPSSFGGYGARSAPPPAALKIHNVGDFIASYVPTVDDFDRLDAQFVIPKESWQQVGGYDDFGFAVFQLKTRSGKPHPMAFTFKSRWNDRVFFPTVHIHDGKVHATEDYDHSLYLQNSSEDIAEAVEAASLGIFEQHKHLRPKWESSHLPADTFCKVQATHGIVAPNLSVYRLRLKGNYVNTDIIKKEVPRGVGAVLERDTTENRLASVACGITAGLTWIIQRRMTRAEEVLRSHDS